MKCREGKDCSEYDIVIGGVAHVKVFNTIELYLAGLIDKSVVLKRLKYERPHMQLCIRNQKIIDTALIYRGCERYRS